MAPMTSEGEFTCKLTDAPVLFEAWYDAVEDKLTLISEDSSATVTIYHPVVTGEPQYKFKCRMELIPENNP